MPQPSTITFTGKSQESHECQVHPLNRDWPDGIPAVYFIIRLTNSGDSFKQTLLYIGETQDLKQRFLNHHKDECYNKNNANMICILEVNNEEKRFEIEQDMIAAYQPPCNG
ncbi:GIY-YIG nuclease family protein [Poriferisphaera sp. WC338]|uniref:GIY-YIG nuclease family protein n=1 Tax=Poriferisphaera sp. WC338 TaxID=3425129 RepID=UPI003D817BD1